MNGKVLLAGLLGGIVLYVWGGLVWTVLPAVGLDLHPVTPLAGPEEAVTALDQLKVDEGVYYGAFIKPGSPEGEEMDMAHIDETKPAIAFMVWRPQGINPAAMTPMFIGGFLLAFLQALLAAFLLNIAAPVIRNGYGGRVLFVVWLGIFASLVVHAMYANWMMFPMGYTLGMIADTVISWLLVGLLLATLIRPATSQTPGAATAL
ncbi:MAG: hypothetical protein M3R04_05200 [bacterium]|nr:hypothetical protein [bacterium]